MRSRIVDSCSCSWNRVFIKIPIYIDMVSLCIAYLAVVPTGGNLCLDYDQKSTCFHPAMHTPSIHNRPALDNLHNQRHLFLLFFDLSGCRHRLQTVAYQEKKTRKGKIICIDTFHRALPARLLSLQQGTHLSLMIVNNIFSRICTKGKDGGGDLYAEQLRPPLPRRAYPRCLDRNPHMTVHKKHID